MTGILKQEKKIELANRFYVVEGLFSISSHSVVFFWKSANLIVPLVNVYLT